MAIKKSNITRLEDLEVKEVSIVDRPANQRRFLTVKSEDGMADKGEEIVADEQGNLITSSGVNTPVLIQPIDSGPTSVLPLEKAHSTISEIFKATGENFEVLEKRLSIDPNVRREVFQSIGESMGRLNSVMVSADFADTDRGDKPSTLTPILAAELLEVSKVIAKTAKMLSTSVKKEDLEVESDFSSAINELSDQLKKVDTKISDEKFAQFEQTIASLEKALGEIKSGSSDTVQRSLETRVSTSTDALEVLFSGLTETVIDLTSTVKKNNSRIATLEHRPGVSNTIPVEKTVQTSSSAGDVHWPIDMNNEKTRETVDKSINFFDN